MKTLRIIRLKPNPLGKDRSRLGLATAAQLGAEWVDFQNTGGLPVDLNKVELQHVAYGSPVGQGHWQRVMGFSGSLTPGRVVRVHSGQRRNISVLFSEDVVGADYHLFTGADRYIWNNREGDTAALVDLERMTFVDWASYDPNPPEGVILVRSGNKLVPGNTTFRKVGNF